VRSPYLVPGAAIAGNHEPAFGTPAAVLRKARSSSESGLDTGFVTLEWPAVFDFVGHPTVATSVQGESLGCDLLAQELLGFGLFVIPLLQLLGTKKVNA
jgi:hypothetical protein